ncbi:MAG: putative membrane protein YkoI [Psychromonas sp.]|jgi:uncharacterized membrane protein YkoI
MKMASILTLAVFLLLPLAATTPSAANDGRGTDLKVSSTAQAVQLVKRQYQGKVLRAQTSNSDRYSGYKVKMISKEGRVFYLFVDAQTGSISGK